jgi:hypothetical protein
VTAPIDVHLKTLLVDRRIADFIAAGSWRVLLFSFITLEPGVE